MVDTSIFQYAPSMAMLLKIDKNGSTPLHIGVRIALAEAIQRGDFKPGEKLPSERELQIQLGISRATIRQALNDLASSGLIYTRSGKGTYVAQLRIATSLIPRVSFSENMRSLGHIPSTRLLDMAVEPAFGLIADYLKIPQGAQIIRIKRLRLTDNIPLGIQKSHLPYDLCFELLKKDFNHASIFDSLVELGLIPYSASQVVKASLPTTKEQKLLAIQAGDPVMRIDWSTYLESGKPIEVANQTYRGDEYQIESSGRI